MALKLQVKKVLVLVPIGPRHTQKTAAAGEERGLGGMGVPVEDRPPSGADMKADCNLPVLGHFLLVGQSSAP